MAYEALARKYRPRTFEEVVGQGPIVRTLTNALREGRIHHAYVFSGVRGVGKTTVARVFAKALNCETGPTTTPCLSCDPCVEIAAGRDLDVIEMDAASRTGVDDVRDLIDTTRYAPARDRYKVFIIDEFHMLSKPAFNALLKTLEEPPPRVVFMMATTELHKVLPTVLSRTQQFDFRKVGIEDIASQLAAIAGKEGVSAPAACFEMLARAADGSVRDAESLLDQAIAFCGTELREADVRALLGLVPDQVVEAFLSAAARREGGTLVRMISELLAEGHDLRVFHAALIEGMRNLLLLRSLAEPSQILGLSADHQARLAAIAETLGTETLLRMFAVLAGLEAPLKYSDQPRYLFEAAAIRLAALADLSPIEDLIARFEGEGPDPGRGTAGAARRGEPAAGARGAAPATRPPGGTPLKRPRSESLVGANPPPPSGAAGHTSVSSTRVSAVSGSGPNPVQAGSSDSASAPPTLAGDRTAASIGEPEVSPPAHGDISTFTPRFLERVAAMKETLAILIEHAASLSFEGQRLVLSFDDTQAFGRKSVEQPENLSILRTAASEVEGRETPVEIRRSPAPAKQAGASAVGRGAPAPREREAPRAGSTAETPGASADPNEETAGTGRTAQARTARTSTGDASSGSRAKSVEQEEAETSDPFSAEREASDLHRRSAPGEPDLLAAVSEGGDPFSSEPAAPPPLSMEPGAFDPPEAASGISGSPSDPPGLPGPVAGGARPDRRPAPAAKVPPISGARYQRLQALALDDPTVKNVLERFGGRIVEIKEIP